MKNFSFVLHYIEGNRHETRQHTESFESVADAQIRARAILKEAKRDGLAVMQIDVYEIITKHVVSYQ